MSIGGFEMGKIFSSHACVSQNMDGVPEYWGQNGTGLSLSHSFDSFFEQRIKLIKHLWRNGAWKSLWQRWNILLPDKGNKNIKVSKRIEYTPNRNSLERKYGTDG